MDKKGKTRGRWMDVADDLAHTFTSADQYLPDTPLTFTLPDRAQRRGKEAKRGGRET